MSNILKSILAEMLDAAEKAPGEPVRRRLSRGLQVDIKIENGKTCLQISRSDKRPDDKEWQYVLKAWPYPVSVYPESMDSETRKYLKAEWPTQPRLIW